MCFSDGDAYRLYNLDVYGYKIHDKMGIYGSVPYLLAHKLGRTLGIFWLNASETLVEINTEPAVKVSLWIVTVCHAYVRNKTSVVLALDFVVTIFCHQSFCSIISES